MPSPKQAIQGGPATKSFRNEYERGVYDLMASSAASLVASTLATSSLCAEWYMAIRLTWTIPTSPRKKLTAARLILHVSIPFERREVAVQRDNESHSTPGGLMVDRRRGVIQIVLRLDNQAPPGPDETSAGQGDVLREREVLGRAGKVSNAGDDKRPLHNGSPRDPVLSADLVLGTQPAPVHALCLVRRK